MSKKIKIFGDVTSVSQGALRVLRLKGLVNEDNDDVVSWVRLSPSISSKDLTVKEAKQLILLEISREGSEPREIILSRLAFYITSVGKKTLIDKINKHIQTNAK